jgi:hypothetical protein
MSAAEALRAARVAGIELEIDGGDLLLEAPVRPPAAVLDVLSRHKAGVVALLRPGWDGWSAEDWQVFFDERAGIAEFEGGLPRGQAEAHAAASCIEEWLNRNFVRRPPERCVVCGGDHIHEPLLPLAIELTGHAWLHSSCWPYWHAKRKTEAVTALAVMGIASPADLADDLAEKEARDLRLRVGSPEQLRA